MRRKKHKNKKKQELFEEIEKQELAEQETKQLNEEIEDPEFRSFSRCLEKISTKNVYGHNECFRNF